MDPEESHLLFMMTKHVNGKIMRGEISSREEAEEELVNSHTEILQNAPTTLPEWHTLANKETDSIRTDRKKYAHKVERNLLKRYAFAFEALEKAIASAELANRAMNFAFKLWLRQASDEEVSHKLLDVEESVGGYPAKFLLLIGMHARMVVISSEIALLLKNGFTDGSLSRMRTLYELVVKAFFLCHQEPTPGGYELAERYCVSSLVEHLKESGENGLNDEVADQVLLEARKRWGDEFFRSENNWAAPGTRNPQAKRITFKDIEEAVDGDRFRHIYVTCNAAVHAGAAAIISALNENSTYLYNNRASINLAATSYIGSAVIFFLQMGSVEVLQRVTIDTKEWDCALMAASLFPDMDAAAKIFHNQGDKFGVSYSGRPENEDSEGDG
ncbi:DUF5677 domain-containing protein [Sphaerimonospora mesophila]|uniref:DUF5677 domain-containing protein n=1 Tax=Sphaerimonospora mesophila TaxID=37483 RepID=UPI000A9397B9